ARGNALWVDGKVIFLNERGVLVMAKARKNECRELARYQIVNLHNPTWTAPVIANGFVYIRNPKNLICFDFNRPSQ
ncbi:hypothetical protein K8I31_17725, partial [bacterium]|nr:hypothetical protein [bacterium]